MGILEWLGVTAPRVATQRTAPATILKSQLGVLTPFSDTNLPALITSDVWGPGVQPPMTRLEAMRNPAVVKARAVLHSLLGRPLIAMRGSERATPQPTWLYRSDTGIGPRRRTLDILDDHIFNEASLLATSRGSEGQILDAVHVPYDGWKVDDDGVIQIKTRDGAWRPAAEGSVIWIPGPWMGLLVHSQDTLRAGRDMETAWMNRVKHPIPPMELHQVEDDQMTKGEAKKYVADVKKNLETDGTAVFFTPHNIELKDHKAGSTDLFGEGRNGIRLDFANLFNIPAAILDGSVSTASLTYSTQEGRRNELFDYTIPYWTSAIEEALSLDNVVPRGQRVAFDFSDLLTPTAAPTGALTED